MPLWHVLLAPIVAAGGIAIFRFLVACFTRRFTDNE